MNFIAERLGKWIQAAIIIVVGILCIVAGAKLGSNSIEAIASAKDVLDGISMTLGIVMIVVGSLSLIMACFAAYLTKGKGFAAIAAPGAVLLAIGISLVVVKYAYTFIDLLIIVVPYLLIALGGVVLIEALFNLFRAIKAKQGKAGLAAFIGALLIAGGALALGILCVGNDPVIKYGTQLIVFGIIVTLIGAVLFLLTFDRFKSTVVFVKTTKE